ncbi:hypothetical protein ACJX0J_019955, partial [Zea mays]
KSKGLIIYDSVTSKKLEFSKLANKKIAKFAIREIIIQKEQKDLLYFIKEFKKGVGKEGKELGPTYSNCVHVTPFASALLQYYFFYGYFMYLLTLLRNIW